MIKYPVTPIYSYQTSAEVCHPFLPCLSLSEISSCTYLWIISENLNHNFILDGVWLDHNKSYIEWTRPKLPVYYEINTFAWNCFFIAKAAFSLFYKSLKTSSRSFSTLVSIRDVNYRWSHIRKLSYLNRIRFSFVFHRLHAWLKW